MQKKIISIITILSLLCIMTGCAEKPGAQFFDKNTEAKRAIPDYSKYIKLGEYKGLTYDFPDEYLYSEENLESDLNIDVATYLADFYAFQDVTDRAVIPLDEVTVVYKGTIDGKSFENSDSPEDGLRFTVGYGDYSQALEEAIIGMNVGETKTVTITIPKPNEIYDESTKPEDKANVLNAEPRDENDHSTKLQNTENPIVNMQYQTNANKDETVDAEYTITLKKISRYQLPEVIDSDELKAKTGYETLDAYKDHLRQQLIEDYDNASNNYKVNQIIQLVIDNSEYSGVPQDEIDQLVEQSAVTATKNAQSAQLSLGDYLKTYYKMDSLDAFKKQMTENANEYMKMKMAICAIAQEENIVIEQSDIDKYEQSIREYYQLTDTADVHDYESESDILFECIAQKVSPILLDNNTEKLIHIDTNDNTDETPTVEEPTEQSSTTENSTSGNNVSENTVDDSKNK